MGIHLLGTHSHNSGPSEGSGSHHSEQQRPVCTGSIVIPIDDSGFFFSNPSVSVSYEWRLKYRANNVARVQICVQMLERKAVSGGRLGGGGWMGDGH